MLNEQNLRPCRTKDEARERGSKGGKASGAARRKQKTFKQLIGLALQQIDPDTGETNDIAVVAALINQAKRGDTKAFAELRNTFEGMLTQKQESKTSGTVSGAVNLVWSSGVPKNADD